MSRCKSLSSPHSLCGAPQRLVISMYFHLVILGINKCEYDFEYAVKVLVCKRHVLIYSNRI